MKSGQGKSILMAALPLLLVFLLAFVLLGPTDTLSTLQWWGSLLVLGFAAWPLTRRLFPQFHDLGYLFGKPIGLALAGYLVWLLSSLKLVPFRLYSVWGAVLLLALISHLVGNGWRQAYKPMPERLAPLTGRQWGQTPPLPVVFIRQETIFLAALVFWAFLRGLKPELAGQDGQEKFMDYGFMNTILRTDFMPPVDIWFSGKPINYYYFGHYLSSFVTRLSGVFSPVGYNLMMDTLFAMAFSLTLSLVRGIAGALGHFSPRQALIAGLISATLLSLGGNLHPLVYTLIFQPNKAAFTEKIPNLEVRDFYWFPDATRFIGHNPKADPPDEDMTIHEFPSYSFVISDLHAHVINLPFVLTLLALLGSTIGRALRREGGDAGDGGPDLNRRQLRGIWPAVLFIAFQIGLFQMTNYWDFPIYATITCAGLFYLYLLRPATLQLSLPSFLKSSQLSSQLSSESSSQLSSEALSPPASHSASLRSARGLFPLTATPIAQPFSFHPITGTVSMVILFLSACVGVLCIYLSYPLYLLVWCIWMAWVVLQLLAAGFRALPRTVLVGAVLLLVSVVIARPFSAHLTSLVNGIKLVPHHSALWQLLVIWGQFWIFMAIFCVIVLVGEERLTKTAQPVGKRAGKHAGKHARKRIQATGAKKPGGAARPTVPGTSPNDNTFMSHLNRTFLGEPGDVFILILLLCATGLVLLPEIIYIKDIYEGGYVRSNTMFKLTYQSFVLYSVSAGYIVTRLFSMKYANLQIGVMRLITGLVVAVMMMYPFHAINSWFGELTPSRYQGLDGSVYLQTKRPDDYAAAQWLKQHVAGQPVVLEANGDSYTDHGRISVETGMPTIQGWWTHEWLWRNNQEMVAERVEHVNEIYTSTDMARTRDLLKQYDVGYIVIGALEREKFPELQEAKLLALGPVVFEQGSIKIVEVATP
jgi:uncharacterized membrane protein